MVESSGSPRPRPTRTTIRNERPGERRYSRRRRVAGSYKGILLRPFSFLRRAGHHLVPDRLLLVSSLASFPMHPEGVAAMLRHLPALAAALALTAGAGAADKPL